MGFGRDVLLLALGVGIGAWLDWSVGPTILLAIGFVVAEALIDRLRHRGTNDA